jgi:thiol-disulfide isomerase/thioredoxin
MRFSKFGDLFTNHYTTMNRLVLFVAVIFFVVCANISYAQSGNRVLFEEFNSSTCPPCATTDPIIENFETQNNDNICVLKWHQNYPAPGNDPYYTANVDGTRANYYRVTGIPDLLVNGDTGFVIYYDPAQMVTPLTAIQTAMPNYYQMNVTHQIVGDSIIVFVTVTSGATQPTASDLNLGVVVAQRLVAYRGANGRPFHSNVVLTAIPSLTASGALNNPFNQAVNTTKTYRYATFIKQNWNVGQLMAVAFIQSASPSETVHPVYQSAWDVPAITISGNGFVDNPAVQVNGLPLPVIAGNASSTANYTITNNTSTAQKVYISGGLTNPANYAVSIGGLASDSSISVPAGGTATVPVSVTSNGPALTSTDYYITARTDSGAIGGGSEAAFGQDIQHAIVDCGGESELNYQEFSQLQTSLKNAGYTSGIINDNSFIQIYGSDWSQFKTVFLDAGIDGGINFNSDTGNITNLLSSGGNVVITGTLFPYFCSVQAPGFDSWMESDFHLESNGTPTSPGYTTISGIAGDPISGSLGKITIAAPYYNATVYGLDDSSHAVFTEGTDTVGMRSTSLGGKTFYSSFELGTISTTKRDAVIKSIMNWFYPSAGVNNSSTPTCSLDPAFPNPLVTDESTIGYTLSDTRFVTLDVRDMMGRKIATLVNREQGAGHYTAPFDASHLANGTYLYTLTAGDYKADGKITVNR